MCLLPCLTGETVVCTQVVNSAKTIYGRVVNFVNFQRKQCGVTQSAIHKYTTQDVCMYAYTCKEMGNGIEASSGNMIEPGLLIKYLRCSTFMFQVA